ncbi:10458_t:CDS:1, partial [Ambispora leptoticha]
MLITTKLHDKLEEISILELKEDSDNDIKDPVKIFVSRTKNDLMYFEDSDEGILKLEEEEISE